jgi:hypothetical protein
LSTVELSGRRTRSGKSSSNLGIEQQNPFAKARRAPAVFSPENTHFYNLAVRSTLSIRDRLRVDIHRGLDVGMSQQFLLTLMSVPALFLPECDWVLERNERPVFRLAGKEETVCGQGKSLVVA